MSLPPVDLLGRQKIVSASRHNGFFSIHALFSPPHFSSFPFTLAISHREQNEKKARSLEASEDGNGEQRWFAFTPNEIDGRWRILFSPRFPAIVSFPTRIGNLRNGHGIWRNRDRFFFLATRYVRWSRLLSVFKVSPRSDMFPTEINCVCSRCCLFRSFCPGFSLYPATTYKCLNTTVVLTQEVGRDVLFTGFVATNFEAREVR